MAKEARDAGTWPPTELMAMLKEADAQISVDYLWKSSSKLVTTLRSAQERAGKEVLLFGEITAMQLAGMLIKSSSSRRIVAILSWTKCADFFVPITQTIAYEETTRIQVVK